MSLEVKDPQAGGLNRSALNRLRERISHDIETGLCDGAVFLVARGGLVACHEAIGSTDKAQGRPARLDDVFLTMSLSKAFVACTVLRLIDRGELMFSTPIAEVIPEFAVRGKQRVTVAHLLTHTGGTYSGFVTVPPVPWADAGDLEKNIQAVSALPIANRPGERVVYNPWASYGVLGEIVRRLDNRGRRFRDIMREEIFAPLGMTSTSYGLAVDHPHRVPIKVNEGTPGAADVAVMESLNQVFNEHSEHPAGGAFATAADVYRFTEMLRRRGTLDEARILSPAIIDYAFQNHTGDKPNGFWDFNKEARDIPDFPANFTFGGGYIRGTGHFLSPFGYTASPRTFGAVGGGSTLFMVDPERDLTFVFLSAGLLEGLNHFLRLQRLADLVLAAVED